MIRIEPTRWAQCVTATVNGHSQDSRLEHPTAPAGTPACSRDVRFYGTIECGRAPLFPNVDAIHEIPLLRHRVRQVPLRSQHR